MTQKKDNFEHSPGM